MGGGGNLLVFDPNPPWEPGLFLAKGRWVWVFEDGVETVFSIVGDHVDLCPLLAA